MVRFAQLCVFVIVFSVMPLRTEAAPCRVVGPNEKVAFDFRETPLRDIARWISCARSLNMMFKRADIGDRKVTWVASRKVKGRSLKRRFGAMLRSEGLRLGRSGRYFVIEPIAVDR